LKLETKNIELDGIPVSGRPWEGARKKFFPIMNLGAVLLDSQ